MAVFFRHIHRCLIAPIPHVSKISTRFTIFSLDSQYYLGYISTRLSYVQFLLLRRMKVFNKGGGVVHQSTIFCCKTSCLSLQSEVFHGPILNSTCAVSPCVGARCSLEFSIK